MTITGTLDTRFMEATEPTDWAYPDRVLEAAELYWLTTVPKDGRHPTAPLVGCLGRPIVRVLHRPDGAEAPQPRAPRGAHRTWQAALDVVVEATAIRVIGGQNLKALGRRLPRQVRRRLGLRRRRRGLRPRGHHRVRIPRDADEGAGGRQVAARADQVHALTPARHGRS
jgi:hypothetical protein